MSGANPETRVSTQGILEALLFAAEDPLPLSQLAELLESTAGAVRDELEQLRLHYEQSDGGLLLLEVAKGFRLVTKPQYAPYIRAMKRPRIQRLSRAGLESLAIIGYNQPITGPEVDHIRGVNSSGALDTLLERGLIEIAGRKETPGRPRLYRTTQLFLDQFGLADVSELPQLPEADLAELTEALFSEGRLAEVSREEVQAQVERVRELERQRLEEEQAAAAAEDEAPTEADLARGEEDFAGGEEDFAGGEEDFAGGVSVTRAEREVATVPNPAEVAKPFPDSEPVSEDADAASTTAPPEPAEGTPPDDDSLH